jgi:hypothetical protein
MTPEEREKKLRRLCGAAAANVPTGLSDFQLDYLVANLDQVGQAVNDALYGILPATVYDGWIGKLLSTEEQCHKAFFGRTFDLTLFGQVLAKYGEERVSLWKTLGWEPHFLPKIRFNSRDKYRGWKTKPGAWFYEQVKTGKVMRRNAVGELLPIKDVETDGTVLLVYAPCKPAYDNGKQMFIQDGNDPIGDVIADLRGQQKIGSYDPIKSWFGISSVEWDEQIRPALATCELFEGVNWRLELSIEANILPQCYKHMPRIKDGTTNTWCWYEEFFESASYRLFGGDSGCGGLADVSCRDAGVHWSYRAVRPLGVLSL